MSLYTTHLIIEHHLDILMQRFVNTGLIHHIEVQSRMALRVRTTTTKTGQPPASMTTRTVDDVLQPQQQQQQQKTASTSITLHELFFVVVLVALGQLTSVAVFGAELLVWRYYRVV